MALLAVLAAFPLGCIGEGGADPYSKRYTARDINPNPAILNSAIVKGTDLSNLRLENVVVKDATIFNTTSRGAVFKNVVFDNCRFINAKFDRAVMENVLFKGGILTCENDPNNVKRRTRFTNSRFVNTVLDGTYLENAVFDGADCSIALRGCLQILAAEPLVTGSDIHLTLERSYFRDMTVAEVTGNSTLTAANCRFESAVFGKSAFVKAVFAKNIVIGPPPYTQGQHSPRSRGR
jgi:uncharacterized protein YjbI with pentapeptide repeats